MNGSATLSSRVSPHQFCLILKPVKLTEAQLADNRGGSVLTSLE